MLLLDDPAVLLVDHLARRGDGRIYVLHAADKESMVYALSSSGEAEFVFQLARRRRDRRLVGVQAAGGRLAVSTYYGASDTPRAWIEVYDLATGELVAEYGPMPGSPLCCRSGSSGDRFTLMRDGSRLLTVGP